MADVGCRNTVFGAEAQVATQHLQLWLDAGIRHFRLEFVHESAQQVRQVIEAFQQALAGEMPFAYLERTLKQLAPLGITEGSLFVPLDYSLVPQLG
jgi:putative protease